MIRSRVSSDRHLKKVAGEFIKNIIYMDTRIYYKLIDESQVLIEIQKLVQVNLTSRNEIKGSDCGLDGDDDGLRFKTLSSNPAFPGMEKPD